MELFEFGSWLNGVVLDRWSLIHFCYGVLFAFLFRMIRLSRAKAYALALFIMIAWEGYERMGKTLVESAANSITDVIIASAGFWLVYWLLPTYRVGRDSVLSLGLSVGVLMLMLVSA